MFSLVIEKSSRTYRHRSVLCNPVSPKTLHSPSIDMHPPWRKMQHIQECSKSIPRNISNLRLVYQCIIEQCRSVLLLSIRRLTLLLPILGLLLLRHSPRDIKPHLNQLILRSSGLAPSTSCTPKVPVGAGLCAASWQ